MLTETKLTSAQPIYNGLYRSGLKSETYTDWSIFLTEKLVMSEASWIIGKADLMDLPLEFQAGLMMAFCAERGCPISIIVPEAPGEVWLADNGNECFAHEDQFTALRDCLADAFLIIDKKEAQP